MLAYSNDGQLCMISESDCLSVHLQAQWQVCCVQCQCVIGYMAYFSIVILAALGTGLYSESKSSLLVCHVPRLYQVLSTQYPVEYRDGNHTNKQLEGRSAQIRSHGGCQTLSII